MVQSHCAVLSRVGAEKEELSSLTDFRVDFKNRQMLKVLEDSIIDLQIILSTMLSTIAGIRDLCKKCCERHRNKREEMCGCDQIIEEFDEHVREVETHVKRAEALREKAKSTTQVVSFIPYCLTREIVMAHVYTASRPAKLRGRISVEGLSAGVTGGKPVYALPD